MRAIVRALFTAMLLTTPALAADLVNTAGLSNVAMSGYDAVAFFTDAKPVNGSLSFSAMHQGAVYFFASEEHKRLFMQSPEEFAPQYGGVCAYGAALEALFHVDISTWQIRNGKLYLNLNHDILGKLNADSDFNVAKADENRPVLVRKNAR